MLQRERTKVIRKLEAIGVTKALGKSAVAKHRFGNRNEWCVDILWERTLYTKDDAKEFIQRWQNGELTAGYRALARDSRRLIREAENLLGLPPAPIHIYP